MSKSRDSPVETQSSGGSDTGDRIDGSTNLSGLKPGSRMRNKRKTKTSNFFDVAMPQSALQHSPSGQATVNDNLMAVPCRMRSVKNFVEAGSSCESERKPSKKVSFSNVVDSHLIKRTKYRKSTFLKGAQHNQSLPRSILKKTGPVTKKHEKKRGKMKAPKIQEAVPTCQSESPKQAKAFLYLDTWKHCKVKWKFEKVIQTWLLKNMLNSSILPDEKFVLLLEYMSEMRGAAVSLARALTTKIIQHSELTADSTAEDTTLEECRRRASLVLQYLPE